MSIEEELARYSPAKDTVLTIGVFDGVHLGHKRLIAQLLQQARQSNALSGLITFRQHPQEVLSPGSGLYYLTDLDERSRLLREEGVDIIIPLSFTHELVHLGARQFVTLLKECLRMRGLIVGPDFALGHNRQGDIETLRQLGQEMGFTVSVVPPVKINGEVVSSTAIRQALADGNMAKVRRLIGRPFRLRGPVVTGAGRGMKLGFPTANLGVSPNQAIPADGVYASWVHINGDVYPSMTYIGTCPTFDAVQRTVEVFILDFSGNLYERDLRIDILERLRGDKKFDSAEALKCQIAEDVKRGREILDSGSKSKI